MKVVDALSLETSIKSGVPPGLVTGPLLFLLFVNDLPTVITLLYAEDVKVVSPRSKIGLLSSSLNNFWKWSVNCDLPINPSKCNYIAIGRATPLQLSFASGSPGDSIQTVNVVQDLEVLMDSSFSPSIHCRDAASKARFSGRSQNFPCSRLPHFITRWFGPIVSALCRPALRTLLTTPIVWRKPSGWRLGS